MRTTVTTSPPTDQATLSCIRCGSDEFDNITADRVWGTCRNCGLDVDLQAAAEYATWLAYEHARGELAFVPETLYCPQCRTERTVVAAAGTSRGHDPYRLFRLTCNHIAI